MWNFQDLFTQEQSMIGIKKFYRTKKLLKTIEEYVRIFWGIFEFIGSNLELYNSTRNVNLGPLL